MALCYCCEDCSSFFPIRVNAFFAVVTPATTRIQTAFCRVSFASCCCRGGRSKERQSSARKLGVSFGGEKVVKRFQWDFECFSCCKSYLPPTQNSELFPLPHAVLTTIIISAWESIEKYTNTHIRCSLALHLYLSLYFMDLCMTPSCIFCCVSLPSMSLYLLIFRKYLRYMASV